MDKSERKFVFSWRDTLTALGILALTTGICMGLRQMAEGDIYVSMLFLLAVALISRFTNGYFYGIAASVVGVLGVNYAFTYPYFKFNLTNPGYPLAFISMLVVAIITSALTTQIKRQEEQRYKAQLEEMRANLFRAVSHDLRTPLTSISSAAAALAANEAMPAEQRRTLLADIVEDSEWMVRMIENLLSITRINAAHTQLHKDLQPAEEVMSEAVVKFKKRYRDIKVVSNVPDELMMVPMDAVLIKQVLTNLLENAAIHGEHTTQVVCRLYREGAMAVFEVTDDGKGIEPNRLEKIFDPMSGTPSDMGGGRRGMGIGLSVCRAIIDAHGGTIRAYNQKEGGARMVFTLPSETEGEAE